MLRKGHILVILVSAICLVTVPVFAQNMGFYENKLYDFSYNLPMDWVYRENYLLPDGSTFQVIQNPKEFEPMHFLQSPIIFVKFENIPESEIPVLNEKEIEKYELEQLRTKLPNAKIIKNDIKRTSWGWESSVEVVVSLNVPLVVKGDFHEVDKTFYYENRESYLVGYSSPVEYYDRYFSVYEKMIDTLVIKGAAVPEFHQMALMVLGGSIILVIIFARKFTKF